MLESVIGTLLLSGVMGLLLYLVLVRPQLRRASQHQAFIASLKAGDHVVTGGGLIGRIVRCDDTIATIEFDGVVGTIDAVRATVHGYARSVSPVQDRD